MTPLLNGGVRTNVADGHWFEISVVSSGTSPGQSRWLLGRLAKGVLSFPHHLWGARAICEALSNEIPPLQSRPQAAVAAPGSQHLFPPSLHSTARRRRGPRGLAQPLPALVLGSGLRSTLPAMTRR